MNELPHMKFFCTCTRSITTEERFELKQLYANLKNVKFVEYSTHNIVYL